MRNDFKYRLMKLILFNKYFLMILISLKLSKHASIATGYFTKMFYLKKFCIKRMKIKK